MHQFNSIEDAVRDIRAGKTVIVVDDEDRENEGDFVCAAEFVDAHVINFLAKYGRGIICAPVKATRAKELG
ncbi:MAG: 3,4-dihydroxy-2-butanone-4-phosphate synthase, partial [Bacteroidetes bacterium]|nr:3,4-dihydroxy-2-butanone-4-phosphate synthase [Bacteroidota bacterium]